MTDLIVTNFPPYVAVPELPISQRALVIAKEIDRLPPGEYTLRIDKKAAALGGTLYYELSEARTLRARELK